jgi:hypothetical protein
VRNKKFKVTLVKTMSHEGMEDDKLVQPVTAEFLRLRTNPSKAGATIFSTRGDTMARILWRSPDPVHRVFWGKESPAVLFR